MVDLFLNALGANEDITDVDNIRVVRAIDVHKLAGYDAKVVCDTLRSGIFEWDLFDATPIFYNRHFIAWLLNDTGFCNISWGLFMDDHKPMVYKPCNPFAIEQCNLKYTWGGVPMTPDNMVFIVKDYQYMQVICKVLINWYANRTDLMLDYSKKRSFVGTSTFATNYSDLDYRARSTLLALLTCLENDHRFLAWLQEQPTTSLTTTILDSGMMQFVDVLKEDLIVKILNYCLEYVTSYVAM